MLPIYQALHAVFFLKHKKFSLYVVTSHLKCFQRSMQCTKQKAVLGLDIYSDFCLKMYLEYPL